EIDQTIKENKRRDGKHGAPHHPLHLLTNNRALCVDKRPRQQRGAGHQRNRKMSHRQPVKNTENRFRNRNVLQSRNGLGHLVTQEENDRKNHQEERRNIKQHGAPTMSWRELLTRWIQRAEVNKEWREENERDRVENSYRQIEI